MFDIKSIEYENNGHVFIINISDSSEVLYKNISVKISNDLVFKYIENLYSIIDDWEEEYINLNIIDGGSWKLYINYSNGNKKVYSGKASYPSNFEAFERLNQKLIEVIYE